MAFSIEWIASNGLPGSGFWVNWNTGMPIQRLGSSAIMNFIYYIVRY
jgi:hypothetical protein